MVNEGYVKLNLFVTIDVDINNWCYVVLVKHIRIGRHTE